MVTQVGGPMFEPISHNGMESVHGKSGSHYNTYYLDKGDQGQSDPEVGMRNLRELFPDGVASEENFVLFSTSGIHGTYRTIEEVESWLRERGDDDWATSDLTVLVVQPQIVCLRCGNVRVRLADVEWLKSLRASSWEFVVKIGAPT